MLILSRNEGEAIIIQVPNHPPIKILLVEVGRSRARIGLAAPKNVTILREELLYTGPAVKVEEEIVHEIEERHHEERIEDRHGD